MGLKELQERLPEVAAKLGEDLMWTNEAEVALIEKLWERIEPDWRLNRKSVLQIAADYEKATGVSVSHTAINKHFRKLGVARDLKAKVQAKADAMVSAAMVSGSVSILTTATDAEIINAEAKSVAEVLFEHRKDIPAKRSLVAKLFQEVEEQTDGKDLIEQLTLALQQGDMEALANQARKIASLPVRIKGVSDLVTAYKSLIALERQAFGIEDGKGDDTLSEAVTAITRRIINNG
jgi:predicted GNAT family acetyltransferase